MLNIKANKPKHASLLRVKRWKRCPLPLVLFQLLAGTGLTTSSAQLPAPVADKTEFKVAQTSFPLVCSQVESNVASESSKSRGKKGEEKLHLFLAS